MATAPAHTAPLQQFSALLTNPETRYINLSLQNVAAFNALFVADSARHPLHGSYARLGASGVSCTPWAAASPICRTREVTMTRCLQETPQVKVVQHVSWWQLNDSNSLLRIRTTTPEWYKAKEVSSTEFIFVSTAIEPSVAAPSASAAKARPLILLTCCYDLEIKRSGLGLFIPVDFAKKSAFDGMRTDRDEWLSIAREICASLPPPAAACATMSAPALRGSCESASATSSLFLSDSSTSPRGPAIVLAPTSIILAANSSSISSVPPPSPSTEPIASVRRRSFTGPTRHRLSRKSSSEASLLDSIPQGSAATAGGDSETRSDIAYIDDTPLQTAAAAHSERDAGRRSRAESASSSLSVGEQRPSVTVTLAASESGGAAVPGAQGGGRAAVTGADSLAHRQPAAAVTLRGRHQPAEYQPRPRPRHPPPSPSSPSAATAPGAAAAASAVVTTSPLEGRAAVSAPVSPVVSAAASPAEAESPPPPQQQWRRLVPSGSADLSTHVIDEHFGLLPPSGRSSGGLGRAPASSESSPLTGSSSTGRAAAASAPVVMVNGPSVGIGPFIVDARTQAEIPVDSEVVALKQRHRLRTLRGGGGAGGDSLARSPGAAASPPPQVETMASGLLLRPFVLSLAGALMWQLGMSGGDSSSGGAGSGSGAYSPSEYVSVYELERHEQQRVADEAAAQRRRQQEAMYSGDW